MIYVTIALALVVAGLAYAAHRFRRSAWRLADLVNELHSALHDIGKLLPWVPYEYPDEAIYDGFYSSPIANQVYLRAERVESEATERNETIENLHQIEIRQTLELLQLRDTNEAQADTLMRLRALMGCQDHENDLAWAIVQDLTETLKDTTDTCLDLQFNRDTVAHELRSVCDKVHRMRGAIHGKDREIAELKELVQIVASDFAATNRIVEIQDRVIVEHLTDREDLKDALATLKRYMAEESEDATAMQQALLTITEMVQEPGGNAFQEVGRAPLSYDVPGCALYAVYQGVRDFAALAANSVPATPEIDEDEEFPGFGGLVPTPEEFEASEARKNFGLDLPF